MSEETKTEETVVTKEPKTEDIVTDNVALLKSRIIALEELNTDLVTRLDALTTKYVQAKDFIEDESKSELIAYISPRYDMAKNLLVLKTLDELKDIKTHIDRVEIPAFKAGTKVVVNAKTSQRDKLDSTFDVAQAKRLGGNK